jgi:large subunit ribosomal protein L29
MKREAMRALREMTLDELTQKLRDTEQELFSLRLQLRSGHLDNHARVRELRRNAARLHTLVHEHGRTP